MAQEQKESIDRTFDQFMQLDLGFRTGVTWSFLTHITSSWVHLKTLVSKKYPLKYSLRSPLQSYLMSTLKSNPSLTILKSYQPILDPPDLSRPLESQEKSSWWRVVVVGGGENQKQGIAQIQVWPSWPSPDLHLTFTRTGPLPELDNSSDPSLTFLTLTWPAPDLHPNWTFSWAWQ